MVRRWTDSLRWVRLPRLRRRTRRPGADFPILAQLHGRPRPRVLCYFVNGELVREINVKTLREDWARENRLFLSLLVARLLSVPGPGLVAGL